MSLIWPISRLFREFISTSQFSDSFLFNSVSSGILSSATEADGGWYLKNQQDKIKKVTYLLSANIVCYSWQGRAKTSKTFSPSQQPNNNCSADLYETIGSTLDSPISSRRSRSRRTQTRIRHTQRDGINHPTDQQLKCNHQTQTLSRDIESLWGAISPSNCFVMDSKNGTIR